MSYFFPPLSHPFLRLLTIPPCQKMWWSLIQVMYTVRAELGHHGIVSYLISSSSPSLHAPLRRITYSPCLTNSTSALSSALPITLGLPTPLPANSTNACHLETC